MHHILIHNQHNYCKGSIFERIKVLLGERIINSINITQLINEPAREIILRALFDRDFRPHVPAEIDAPGFDDALEVERLTELKTLRRGPGKALRLCPPVWLYSRRAPTAATGVEIPADMDIFIRAHLVLRDRDRPDRVDPMRLSDTAFRAPHQQTFIPFPVGLRRRIGGNFGRVEVLAHNAIRRKRFHLRWPKIEREAEVNLRCIPPFNMTLEHR